jgi:hypothetical protein
MASNATAFSAGLRATASTLNLAEQIFTAT